MEKSRVISNLFRYRGSKSITRVLLNTRVEEVNFRGVVLDLGAGRNPAPSYCQHMGHIDRDKMITLNASRVARPEVLADLENGLPFRDGSVGCVLLFNVLEHIYHYQQLCTEIARVLPKGGVCYVFVPFIHRIHGDPNDYFRYSEQAVKRILSGAGFGKILVEALGFGPFTTACSFVSFPRRLRTLSPLLFLVGMAMDEALARRAPFALGRRYPLAYFVTCTKDKTGRQEASTP